MCVCVYFQTSVSTSARLVSHLFTGAVGREATKLENVSHAAGRCRTARELMTNMGVLM